MASKPLADLPGHKRFDADIRELASLAQKLSTESTTKAGKAKSSKEREMFESLSEEFRQQQQAALAMRHKLWEVLA